MAKEERDSLPDVLDELRFAALMYDALRGSKKSPPEPELSPLPRVLDLEPKELPDLRHRYVQWIRTQAAHQWEQQHKTGAAYVAPPSLSTANPLRPDFTALTGYYADIWAQGRLYSVTPEMTTLAYRTTMDRYRLSLENLPSPTGVIFWQQPIGTAEMASTYQVPINLDTGEIDTSGVNEVFASFREDPSPIMAACWRYDPDNNLVWVAFHSDHGGFMDNLLANFTYEEKLVGRAMMAPIGFEREQALPLDVTLAWPDAEDSEMDKLPVTALSVAASIGVTEQIREKGRQRNEEAKGPVTQMVKTLIASWLLMKWKIAQGDDVQLPRPARKRLVREGIASRETVEATSTVRVIRLGAPIKRKPTKASAAGTGGKWKVRAIIGPHIRNRQYIPAHDTYDETPRLIEPYIAGPEGAPISNADKVFLLGE